MLMFDLFILNKLSRIKINILILLNSSFLSTLEKLFNVVLMYELEASSLFIH